MVFIYQFRKSWVASLPLGAFSWAAPTHAVAHSSSLMFHIVYKKFHSDKIWATNFFAFGSPAGGDRAIILAEQHGSEKAYRALRLSWLRLIMLALIRRAVLPHRGWNGPWLASSCVGRQAAGHIEKGAERRNKARKSKRVAVASRYLTTDCRKLIPPTAYSKLMVTLHRAVRTWSTWL